MLVALYLIAELLLVVLLIGIFINIKKFGAFLKAAVNRNKKTQFVQTKKSQDKPSVPPIVSSCDDTSSLTPLDGMVVSSIQKTKEPLTKRAPKLIEGQRKTDDWEARGKEIEQKGKQSQAEGQKYREVIKECFQKYLPQMPGVLIHESLSRVELKFSTSDYFDRGYYKFFSSSDAITAFIITDDPGLQISIWDSFFTGDEFLKRPKTNEVEFTKNITPESIAMEINKRCDKFLCALEDFKAYVAFNDNESSNWDKIVDDFDSE